jgi:formate--tetrahydrofolate ligase
VRALKYHGGAELKELGRENLEAIDKGMANLERHVRNVKSVYGLPCVVAINHFTQDTEAEIELIRSRMGAENTTVVVARHWAEGGKGAEDLAREVVRLVEQGENNFHYVYDDDLPLWDKVKAVATKVYDASEVTADNKVRQQIAALQEQGYGHYPVCIAKTQYSFSTDPTLRGAPIGHTLNIREVRLCAGAQFVVMVCGDIMTMPGLPKAPAATKIDLTADGKVVGLF